MNWGSYLARGAFSLDAKEPVQEEEHEIMVTADVEIPPTFSTRMYPQGVNADFLGLTMSPEELVDTFKQRLENPENRDIARAIPEIIQLCREWGGLSQGSRVIDFGTGTGLLLQSLSETVSPMVPSSKRIKLSESRIDKEAMDLDSDFMNGELSSEDNRSPCSLNENISGEVIATEISQAFATHLLRRIETEGLSNVHVVYIPDRRDPNLSRYEGQVDLILVIDVYHHLEWPISTMRGLYRLLKPEGRLIVLDFIRDISVHKSHPGDWILEHVRAGQEVFRSEITSCGFRLVGEPKIEALEENYVMVFRPSTSEEMEEMLSTQIGAGWAKKSFPLP